MREKTKVIFVRDKKTQLIGGFIALVIVVVLFVFGFCLTNWDKQELWEKIFAGAMFAVLMVLGILSMANGIYIFPSGKVLCVLSLKVRLFKLDDTENVAIEFHQQYNGKYLTNITVRYLDGRVFNQNYIKQANDFAARKNGSGYMMLIKQEQVYATCRILENQAKFSVSVKNLIEASHAHSTFTELLSYNEEFVFYYKGVAYEIVMSEDDLPSGHTLSLYLSDGQSGKFIQSFEDKDDLLQNGEIDGKKICTIIDEIVV